MSNKKVLIMVDLQNDFCTGGSLAVRDGEAVMPIANQLQNHFDTVIATQDWHPREHMSFATNHAGVKVGDVIDVHGYQQMMWPDHCVQSSTGAKFHPQLQTQSIKKVIQKGTDPSVDSYSAFYDNEHAHSTGLGEYLRDEQITDVFIMGLATDYCVKFSVLDALALGFQVTLIADACRGVDLQPGDVERALEEMRVAGATVIQSQDVLSAK